MTYRRAVEHNRDYLTLSSCSNNRAVNASTASHRIEPLENRAGVSGRRNDPEGGILSERITLKTFVHSRMVVRRLVLGMLVVVTGQA
jgi:hypothetical protein